MAEQVIASGPGISSWFVPTTLEGRVGGTTVSSFAPHHNMDTQATITQWEPPRRFVAESIQEGPGKVATEWTVEAKAGGTCKVRITGRARTGYANAYRAPGALKAGFNWYRTF